ncbi:hypothetical protein [Leptobacterium sp. I13]|uniref:hypothetical protein n=1 Tax=Leptobacterium meishanense TaxID=3128904 RepID=UPI0030EDD3AC
MRKLFLFLSTGILLACNTKASPPKYASEETKEVILKMIEAHGGMKKWKSMPSFSFENIMYSESLPGSPFWINEVYVDQKTRRVYQYWPLFNSSMAYDGEKTWSLDWRIGNTPKFDALFFYYFLNLPWITQDDNVKLGEVKKIKHKAFKNEVYVIDMGFTEKPIIGKTQKDTYKLYIDSTTYLLMGYEYMIGYGAMLDLFNFPQEKELFGPMFRINDAFREINGLTYPILMHTGNTEQTENYGNHAIINIKTTEKFDESLLKMPERAVIDNSSHLRGNQKQ